MIENTIEAVTKRVGDAATQIPDHMRDGLMLYLTDGIRPGQFLAYILANDFAHATGRADEKNQRSLFGWAVVLNSLPGQAWGSPETVAAWIKGKGMRAWENEVKEG